MVKSRNTYTKGGDISFPSSNPFAYPTKNPLTNDLLTFASAEDKPKTRAVIQINTKHCFILIMLGYEESDGKWKRKETQTESVVNKVLLM